MALNPLPMILLSGMGADSSIYKTQKIAFPNLVVPAWPVPRPKDCLAAYAHRLAKQIDPGRPCVIGGASFGGIVAIELMQHLDVAACFLIGSVRGAHQLPKRFRAMRLFSTAIDFAPVSLLQRSTGSSSGVIEAMGSDHIASVANQFANANPTVVRWSAKQLLSWKTQCDAKNVFHIHGSRDRVFPLRHVTPDEIVHGGGHVISMTHGRQVNAFLRKHISSLS